MCIRFIIGIVAYTCISEYMSIMFYKSIAYILLVNIVNIRIVRERADIELILGIGVGACIGREVGVLTKVGARARRV